MADLKFSSAASRSMAAYPCRGRRAINRFHKTPVVGEIWNLCSD
jgi:hypothetical protein